jgi:hypothetical protein
LLNAITQWHLAFSTNSMDYAVASNMNVWSTLFRNLERRLGIIMLGEDLLGYYISASNDACEAHRPQVAA